MVSAMQHRPAGVGLNAPMSDAAPGPAYVKGSFLVGSRTCGRGQFRT